jgi:hypothetical protein
MLEIPQGAWDKKGTWKGLRSESGKRTANLCCPKCGQNATLHDHEIASDGTVRPSVVCPYPGCTFHERIKLIGW